MTDGDLYGEMDGNSDARARGLSNLVVLANGKISMPISQLVSIADPNVSLFRNGGARFGGLLVNKDDFLTNAPLEEAYLWAPACRLAVSNVVSFNSDATFCAKCTHIRPGRIFETSDPKKWNDLHDLDTDVMYYADEPGRGASNYRVSHPRADMWFRSTNGNHVVLIDITGGIGITVTDKVRKFQKTILAMQADQALRKKRGESAISVHGVILAPACEAASTTDAVGVDDHTGPRSMITTVCDQDAREAAWRAGPALSVHVQGLGLVY